VKARIYLPNCAGGRGEEHLLDIIQQKLVIGQPVPDDLTRPFLWCRACGLVVLAEELLWKP
jgi:hypothetical protein